MKTPNELLIEADNLARRLRQLLMATYQAVGDGPAYQRLEAVLEQAEVRAIRRYRTQILDDIRRPKVSYKTMMTQYAERQI